MVLDEPTGDASKALRKQINVEAKPAVKRIVVLLAPSEQVEQQRGDARMLEHPGDIPITGAQPTAAAAVGEENQPMSVGRDGQITE